MTRPQEDQHVHRTPTIQHRDSCSVIDVTCRAVDSYSALRRGGKVTCAVGVASPPTAAHRKWKKCHHRAGYKYRTPTSNDHDEHIDHVSIKTRKLTLDECSGPLSRLLLRRPSVQLQMTTLWQTTTNPLPLCCVSDTCVSYHSGWASTPAQRGSMAPKLARLLRQPELRRLKTVVTQK